MIRLSSQSVRRVLAALLLAFALARPEQVQASPARPAVGALPAQYLQYANRSSMIQVSLVAVAAGILLLYKK